jgi:hypothetical protein
MKRNHPNFDCGAWILAIALPAALCGCGGHQRTASINPFLGPGRVPPPATRTLVPGAAQPYYPGDPLPTMHSATSGASAPSAVVPALATTGVTAEAPTIASSNEPSIAVPSDNGTLRFAAPAPPAEPAPFMPAAGSMPIADGSLRHAPPQSQIVPEADDAPIEPAFNANSNTASPTGPWRSPRLSAASVPDIAGRTSMANRTAMAQQVRATRATPMNDARLAPNWSPPTSSIDVRLRAVPSPGPQGVHSTVPRIRLPEYPLQSQAVVMPNGTIQQVGYAAMPATMNGGVTPTVGLTVPQPTAMAGRDGFRPRGSMR